MASNLAEASRLTGRQVGALVARSGEVEYVVVGDAARIVLPDVGRIRVGSGRFRGLRLVHTHLRGEPITRDDLVDLSRLRLDLVAALHLTPEGHPWMVEYAHLVPENDGGELFKKSARIPVGRLDADFAELIRSLEAEFARASRAHVVGRSGRGILVHVSPKRAAIDAEESMRELGELARTAGVEVVDRIVQFRDKIDPRTVLGRGRLDDVLLTAMQRDANVVIFDRNLSPSQAGAISKLADVKVIDRTQLILDIFAQHAETRDGKLQVELAQLKYMLPRLSQKDDSLSRLTGGIGGRGPGETKLEIGRRRARERIAHLEDQVDALSRQRKERRRTRERNRVPVVAIVGYTNAGKSTLLNTLTGSDVLAENKLFATLDPRSRRLRFPEAREVILTDTVGFIRDLPKDLLGAFRATFEEVRPANVLLHVVDASDRAWQDQLKTVEGLLCDLELERIPRILVFNKADRLAPAASAEIARAQGGIVISALDAETTRPLLERIEEQIWRRDLGDRIASATGSSS